MTNLFDKVKAVCAFVVMGLGLAAYSAAPTVTSVTAQQRYPWNGLVDIAVTFNGEQGDVAKATCTFAATNSATKAALAIAHVTPQGNDTGSGTTWTRRFIWDTNADLGEVKIDDLELFATVEAVADEPENLGGVQLWEGGPYWATCNVGASKPEEYGLYFWWGDTEGHSSAGSWFSDETCPTWKYGAGWIDSTGNLVAEHDAALAYLGAPWRMPTCGEFDALISNCTTEWTTRNDVYGQLVKGKGAYATKSIFLPAAGCGSAISLGGFGDGGFYWSSTSTSCDLSWYLHVGSKVFYLNYYGYNYLGFSVRPVRGSAASTYQMFKSHLSLDNRTGTRVAAATERICFSPAWETDASGATAVVSVNGEVVKNATDSGVFEWTPAQDGIYQLTHAVYVNGVQVGKMLAATFRVGAMAVVPTAMDWTTGTIEIGWEGTASAGTGSQVTYDVYWSTRSNGIDHVVREAVTGLSCTDDKYLDHGEDDDGIRPIYYTVVGSDGSMGCCLTRRRYASSAGYTTFSERLNASEQEAVDFLDLFCKAGGVVDKESDVKCLIDGEATTSELRRHFSNVKDRVRPGDIFSFYVHTHGRSDSKNRYESILTRDGQPDGESYSTSDMRMDFDAIGKKGALSIVILNTCGSGALAQQMTSAANTAWITATSGNEESHLYNNDDGNAMMCFGKPYSFFGLAFLEWGWENGLAGKSKRATYYDLAKYAREHFGGTSSDRLYSANAYNASLLEKIAVFADRSKSEVSLPSAPEGLKIDALQMMLKWDPSPNANYYKVYRRIHRDSDDKNFDGWELRPRSSYQNDGLLQYDYCVSAVNAAGEGPMSAILMGVTVSRWVLDLVSREISIAFHTVVGSSSSAFELFVSDDGTVEVQGEMSDGSPIAVRSCIECVDGDVAEIPLKWVDNAGSEIGVVIHLSKSGAVSIKDGACTKDGAAFDVEFCKSVVVTPRESVLMEGESPVFDVALSEPCSKVVYVYLRPMNEAASNCCASLSCSTISSSSAGLCISPGKTACTGQLAGVDGGRSRLEFKPVVCTSSTFDESKVLSEYEGEPFELEVRNVAPELIVVGWGDPDQIMSVAMRQDVVIRYQVRDVAADLQAGVSVSFAGDGVGSETVAVTDGGLHQQVVRFTTAGTHAVRITAKDKDGASASRTLYFSVQPQDPEVLRKLLRVAPLGPSTGLGMLMQEEVSRYATAAGLGAGRVWAAGLDSVSGFVHTFDCGESQTATVRAFGYKVGDVTDGTSFHKPLGDGTYGSGYYDTFCVQLDASGNPRGSSPGYAYQEPSMRDSFLYGWLIGTPTAGGGLDCGTLISPEAVWGASASSLFRLRDVKTASGAYADTFACAVFAKEYLPSDNMGDINADGIPDLAVQRYFGTSAYTDDLADLSREDSDVDELDDGTPFVAKLELRGYGEHLNDALVQLGITGVKPDRVYTDPAEDAKSTLTPLEYLAWTDFKAAHPEATVEDWSPERPTDPTCSDTDGDWLIDGFEYWWWYRAHVGWIDEDGNHRYAVGRRYNPESPFGYDVITSAEIEALVDPLVPRIDGYSADSDGDGLPDVEEYENMTNPFEFDEDGDGLPDGLVIETAVNDDGTLTIINVENPPRILVLPGEIGGCAVSKIGDYALHNLRGTIKVVVPNGVVSIGNSAFHGGYDDLTEVVLPETLKEIGHEAFASCRYLSEVTIPSGVRLMGDRVFAVCGTVESPLIVNFLGEAPDSMYPTSRPMLGYPGCVIVRVRTGNGWGMVPGSWWECATEALADDGFYRVETNETTGAAIVTGINGTAEGTLILPSEIGGRKVEIGPHVFSGCAGLKRVVIPESVDAISEFAFVSSHVEELYFLGGVPASMKAVDPFSYWCYGFRPYVFYTVKYESDWKVYYNQSHEYTEPGRFFRLGGYVAFEATDPHGRYPDQKWCFTPYEEGVMLIRRRFVENGRIKSVPAVSPLTERVDEIPEELCGLPVVRIGDAAFAGCSEGTIGRLDFPRSLRSIGKAAFSGCSDVREVILPETLAEVGDYAFCGCSRLSRIASWYGDTAQASNRVSIGKAAFANCPNLMDAYVYMATNVGDLAFANCERLMTVRWAYERPVLKDVGASAFAGTGLYQIILPASVERIGECAFSQCVRLGEIELPVSLANLGAKAFAQCELLRSVRVRGEKLAIGDFAFAECSSLCEVVFDSITTACTIGEAAFSDCGSLKTIRLPKGVSRIGDCAFADCAALSDVYFDGAMPETFRELGVFDGANRYLVSYVRSADGWGTLPGEWEDRPVELWGDYPNAVAHRVAVFDFRNRASRTGGGELVQRVTDSAEIVEPQMGVSAGLTFAGWDFDYAEFRSALKMNARYVDSQGLEVADYYVSPSGNDGNDGRSRGTAFRSLNAAIERAEDGALILVADGEYAPVSVAFADVVPRLEIRSEHGAEKAVISGRGVSRCVTLMSEWDYDPNRNFGEIVMRGFTFRDGHVDGLDGMPPVGGGVLGGTYVDCVITDCAVCGEGELAGGGACGATLFNSRIVGNAVRGEGVCIAGGAADCELYHCTIADNTEPQIAYCREKEFMLGEAVNATSLCWGTGGSVDWQSELDENAADGLHDAKVTGLGNDSSAWIETTVNGPGTISFAWCGELSSRNTKLQFLVDGMSEAILTGSNGWQNLEVSVCGDGDHALTWKLLTGRSGACTEDFAALDCVRWIPAVETTLTMALNSNLVWCVDGDAEWHGIANSSATAEDAWAMVSGLGDFEYAGVETRVYGSGTLRFDWSVSCEEDYDELVLIVDGKPCKSITGEIGWKPETIAIDGKDWHTIRWEYVKDDYDEWGLAGANCAMLNNVVWDSTDEPTHETENTPVPVPFEVIETKYKPYLDAAGGDYEAAALAVGRNGYAIWECYVAGLEPDDQDSKFKIVDIKFEDGELKVMWSPDLNENGTKNVRKYTEFGRKELGGTEAWTDMKDVNPAEKNDYKFRKVTVDMP